VSHDLQTYLVGGALRDKLLGLPVTDRDYVVVGATPEKLEAAGFQRVGRDFPVFLHPQTKEEYALARTERKSGHGYRGFTCEFSDKVTLEEDLVRRDLTINAMAEDASGNIIDPFKGQQDLEDRVLRHVSPAFSEDPVRVLRVARFAARFHQQGFKVAEETMALMQQMVESGEVAHLVAERVWKELSRALEEQTPSIFFEVLRACSALKVLWKDLDDLWGVPQPEKSHPEIDTGVHAMMVLDFAAQKYQHPLVTFAALCHDLGKGKTPAEKWPRHIAHEERGVPLVKDFCKRYKVPNQHRDIAILVTRHHGVIHRALELRPETIYKLFKSIDVLRQPERLEWVLSACHADSAGRKGLESIAYPQKDYLKACFRGIEGVKAATLQAEGFDGVALGKELDKRRIAAIKQVKQQQDDLAE
jgi:tRNA nucleotidyltransferase (CCA-adding enzyme)